MKRQPRERRGNTSVTASELAIMGRCERQIVLMHRPGPGTAHLQRAARLRGVGAHQEFQAEGERELIEQQLRYPPQGGPGGTAPARDGQQMVGGQGSGLRTVAVRLISCVNQYLRGRQQLLGRQRWWPIKRWWPRSNRNSR